MAKWFLLRVGLPMGILIAVWPGLIGPAPTLTDFVRTACVTSLVLVGGLWTVASAFQRLGWRSRRSAVTLALLLAAGTVTGGMTALWWTMQLPHGSWTRLPDPPEQPQGLVGPTCLTSRPDATRLFVVTSTGRYLGYGLDSALQPRWTVRSSLPDDPARDQARCEETSGGRPPPRIPGDVVAVHRVEEFGVDCGGTTYYLLRSGGSVWTWSDYTCALVPAILYLAYCVLFAVLGLAAGATFARRQVEER